jgi:hypothetical protein
MYPIFQKHGLMDVPHTLASCLVQTMPVRLCVFRLKSIWSTHIQHKGGFTLTNFARDFTLSLHVLLNKNYLFSLLNVQASAKSCVKSCAKSRQCKRTFKHMSTLGQVPVGQLVFDEKTRSHL